MSQFTAALCARSPLLFHPFLIGSNFLQTQGFIHPVGGEGEGGGGGADGTQTN